MFRHMPLIEKIVIFLLFTIIVIFSWQVFCKFHEQHSYAAPSEGGVYTEGLVGRLTTLNPLLARSSADRDVSSLIFAGLTRFNPVTGQIEGDLADFTLSENMRTYTFRLKENVYWHDGEPVTTDDIIYTYKVVLQNPYFKNSFLRGAFKDVEIERITDREVTFTLKSPYAFFLTNVTVGLLPKHLLNLVPIENLEKADFHQHPIGSGPFEFVSMEHKSYESRVVLKRFEKYHLDGPYIDSVVFRVFPSQNDLIANVNSLTAVKNYDPKNSKHILDSRFRLSGYTLPQYVAAFLNTQSSILSVPKTRFGLLLATDKDAIAKELGGQKEIVDTPILEAKEGLDIEYNELRAKGAFFDTEWKLKKRTEDSIVPVSQKYHVVIEAKSDSWVQLSVDNEKQDGILFRGGDKKQFDFENVFTFVNVGNAGGIVFSVNGIQAKLLGLEGEVVKNFDVTRDNLSSVLTEELPVVLPIRENSSDILAEAPAELSAKEQGDDDISQEEYVPPDDAQEVFMLHPDPMEIRYNANGKPLRLRLITSSTPEEYVKIARLLQDQWFKAGVDLIVEVYDPDLLQSKIRDHNYDVLLFGQNLGYNLDAFPFWHSSQVESGLNLSQYKSFESDLLLTEIRSLFDNNKKVQKLDALKKQIINDTPAIFLYRPVYQYAVDRKVQGVDLSHMGVESDRLGEVRKWYVKEKRVLSENIGLEEFIQWIYTHF